MTMKGFYWYNIGQTMVVMGSTLTVGPCDKDPVVVWLFMVWVNVQAIEIQLVSKLRIAKKQTVCVSIPRSHSHSNYRFDPHLLYLL